MNGFSSYIRTRKDVLHSLWNDLDVNWGYRENFINNNFSVSSQARTGYKNISDETLRLFQIHETNLVIKGLIFHRENILSEIKKFSKDTRVSIKTLDVHRRNEVREMIQIYRTITLYIIENIQKWISQNSNFEKKFLWNGIDIIHKISYDFLEIINKIPLVLVVLKYYDYSSKSPLVKPINEELYRNEIKKNLMKSGVIPLGEKTKNDRKSFFITETRVRKKKKISRKRKFDGAFLRDINKLPSLLIPQKYTDVSRKQLRNKTYSRLLLNLRHNDLMDQVRLDKKKEPKISSGTNTAIRKTNKIISKLRKGKDKLNNMNKKDNIIKLTSQKRQVVSKFGSDKKKALRKREWKKQRANFKFTPNLQKEFERIVKAEFYVVKHVDSILVNEFV